MHQRSAFTLVELSIVLVILGLLIGGVLTGQSLIRAAELRSVTTQYSRYVTAVQTFRDKYFAIPGDMTNATAYWGTATTCPGDAAHIGPGNQTCNGDGDGLLNTAATTSNETYRFWQHLANAGLIEGSYDGVTHGSVAGSSTAANSPSGRISASLWWAYNWELAGSGAATWFNGQYGNTLEFGGVVANSDPDAAIFKPEEIYNIDTKMDDGKPATGKIVMRAYNSWAAATNCTDASGATVLSANYNLGVTTVNCLALFRQAF